MLYRLVVDAVLVLSDVPWLSGTGDVEIWVVTVGRALCSSLASVADSNNGSKLLGSVIGLAKVVVAFVIVKFEISAALKGVPFPATLEFVMPVTFKTLTAGIWGDVGPSWKAMASQPKYCKAFLRISSSLMVVISSTARRRCACISRAKGVSGYGENILWETNDEKALGTI